MAIWLFKTEPGDYSYADLERDGKTVWDGVGNNWALKNLREVAAGDRALIYHTGKDKAVMGEAKVTSDPYPDPELDDPKMAVVDIEPLRAWSNPVKLADIKADPAFAEFMLVKFSRLSVMPVDNKTYKRLEKMSR
jgi:predicted RNA-binding protein with PUA-like domain